MNWWPPFFCKNLSEAYAKDTSFSPPTNARDGNRKLWGIWCNLQNVLWKIYNYSNSVKIRIDFVAEKWSSKATEGTKQGYLRILVRSIWRESYTREVDSPIVTSHCTEFVASKSRTRMGSEIESLLNRQAESKLGSDRWCWDQSLEIYRISYFAVMVPLTPITSASGLRVAEVLRTHRDLSNIIDVLP